MRTPNVQANILAKLNEQGGTVEWLSQKTGIDHKTLTDELAGTTPVTFHTAILIAGALDTSPETFMGMEATGSVLGTRAAAAYCGIALQTLYNLISQGKGPRAHKRGRRNAFYISDLRAWNAEYLLTRGVES